MKRKIDRLLEEYQESHQNSTNKMIHWICIPAIFFSIYGLLLCAPHDIFTSKISHLSIANVFIVFTLIYYLTLSFQLFLSFLIWATFVVIGNYWLLSMSWNVLFSISVITFVSAWIAQFIGHSIEGKKPSFLKDLQFLLIGPAWLMVFIFKKAGINY